MIAEGKKAPSFKLTGTDGEVHSLGDYLGGKVLLYFYPKDDTPGCTKEACGFRDGFGELKAHGVTVLGVSKDGVEAHQRFTDKYDLPFLLLSDPDLKMMKAYGAFGTKKLYGKEVQGTIRSTVLINEDGVVQKHWKTVRKAAEHPQQVLDYLKDA